VKEWSESVVFTTVKEGEVTMCGNISVALLLAAMWLATPVQAQEISSVHQDEP
jgi:hypothetical protein